MKNEVIKNELKITYPIEAKLFMFDVLRVGVFIFVPCGLAEFERAS